MQGQTSSFFNGISFQLAKIGIVLAVVLSVLMSSVQLYLDFQDSERELDAFVKQVISVAKPPAARSVATLDEELSDEVVNGLLEYGFIYEVVIADEQGNILSQASNRHDPTSTRWLTEKISEPSREYKASLAIPGYSETTAGTIRFKVDMD